MRNVAKVVGLSLSLSLLGGAAAYAEDDADDIDIDKITCREMLKMGNNEREFTIVFLHGYMSGQKSELMFDGSSLAEATDAVLDTCIDDPDQMLLTVFEKARS